MSSENLHTDQNVSLKSGTPTAPDDVLLDETDGCDSCPMTSGGTFRGISLGTPVVPVVTPPGV